MKIQNEYIELTNDADSKYKLSVKKGNNIKHKMILEYLEKNFYNFSVYGTKPHNNNNFIEGSFSGVENFLSIFFVSTLSLIKCEIF